MPNGQGTEVVTKKVGSMTSMGLKTGEKGLMTDDDAVEFAKDLEEIAKRPSMGCPKTPFYVDRFLDQRLQEA
ncbi:MAG: hypothetical protein HW380_3468 [Magnetococcales bacterium]|nr:hypothetical protein [Magnetococcales bacterium]